MNLFYLLSSSWKSNLIKKNRTAPFFTLKEYQKMLLTTIRIVRKEMKEGKSVEETKNANVLERWKAWGRFLEFLNTDYWMEAIYKSFK